MEAFSEEALLFVGNVMRNGMLLCISTKNDAQGNPENQCAHFVSHVMGFDGEITCKNKSDADKKVAGMGAMLRVNQLFKRCPEVDYWEKRSLGLSSLLIFVTRSSNMGHDCLRLDMGEHPRKHVGIFVDGKVWHHGKTQVESDTESAFITKFNAFERIARTAYAEIDGADEALVVSTLDEVVTRHFFN